MPNRTVKEIKEDTYQLWKSMGLKRRVTQELADAAGKSRQTLYKWIANPIIDEDGNKFDDWESRLAAETSKSRETFRTQCKLKFEQSYELMDAVWDEMLMKYAERVFDPNFKISIDELEKYSKLRELIHTRLNGDNTNKPISTDLVTSINPNKPRFTLSAPREDGVVDVNKS